MHRFKLSFNAARRAYLLEQIQAEYGTASALAKHLGITRTAISRVIAGTSRSARIERILADMTGIPLDELFPRERAA